ncbi:hypothetical protein P0W64_06815 [Tsukamurella sp. 8F]|uniref:hypothetical protein n=1 Tax=unclassified Tsukamurella TaxID=2633480 RepID=UPI0023B9C2D7|nr:MULTISPECIES: hypothetical protein [unclassified Tsukamurella]MDF0530166.1 hypothetical protein [Tsukamurella sp. 8J]MDF0586484.1 hypothetical protein [Tsukamurella sp. 8F]
MIGGFPLAVLLADDNAPKGPEFGKASPVGLLVIVVLCVATFLLIKSMNRHVKNLPESFDESAAGPGERPGDAGSDGAIIDHGAGDEAAEGDGAVKDRARPQDKRHSGGSGPKT